MRLFYTCLILCAVFSSQTEGQVFIDTFEGEEYSQFSNMDTDWATLLLEGNAGEELELLDYQRVELDKLIQATGVANAEANNLYFKTFKNLKTPEEQSQALKDFQAALDKNETEFKLESAKHLLPHQVVRLKRLAVVRQLEHVGIESLMLNQSPIGSALQLSPEESEKLKAKATEVGKRLKTDIAELEKKISDLKLQAAEEILNELPADKRNIIRSQFGL